MQNQREEALEPPGLACNGLTLGYDGRPVIEGLDLSLPPGASLAIVGESGCGKSTLLTALAGLRPAISGTVRWTSPQGGVRSIQDMRTSFVWQHLGLFPWKRVRENLALPLELSAGRCADSAGRVSAMLFELRLSGLESRFPSELSGGQRQRIGIAKALSLNPEFIVCDEPISALDVSIQAQVINMFEDLQQEMGLTYLFIAHDLSVVKHISNRIGVMYLGKMVELADSYELITHSIHPYTRSLISAIPVADPITARQSKRIVLQGDVPSPLNPPSGCRFRTRCPYADEQCANEVPEFKEVSTGHWAACHHLDRVK